MCASPSCQLGKQPLRLVAGLLAMHSKYLVDYYIVNMLE